MPFSTYLGNSVLNKVLRNVDFTVVTPYVSLHTGDPGLTGANEVVGGGYARPSAAFAAAANKATDNTNNITYSNMPACTITHVGLWDAATLGNFLWGGSLTASKVINAGDTFQFNLGDLDASIN